MFNSHKGRQGGLWRWISVRRDVDKEDEDKEMGRDVDRDVNEEMESDEDRGVLSESNVGRGVDEEMVRSVEMRGTWAGRWKMIGARTWK